MTGIRDDFYAESLSWSPDGTLLAVADRADPQSPRRIGLYPIRNPSGNRQMTSPPKGVIGDRWPSFSPDGRVLAFIRDFGIGNSALYVVELNTGEERSVTVEESNINGVAWEGDGDLLFSTYKGGGWVLRRVGSSGGAVRDVAGFGENADMPAISRRGDRLVYRRRTTEVNLWRMTLPHGGVDLTRPQRLPVSSTREERAPQFSRDGSRLAFESNRGGTWEIWVCDPGGRRAVKVTSFGGPLTVSPHWSPDSKELVFDSRPDGNADIFVISPEVGVPRRLTTDPAADMSPSWSGDGKWIVFVSNRSGRAQIWRMSAEGDEPVQLTQGGAAWWRPLTSPDGRFVYYSVESGAIWRVPSHGGKAERIVESPTPYGQGSFAVFEDGIYFVEVERESLKDPLAFVSYLDFATQQVTRLIQIDGLPLWWSSLAVSPDRRWAVWMESDRVVRDLMLVENFH